MTINTIPNIHNLILCSNVFVRIDGKYLMIKRSDKKEFAPGYFSAIGGKVNLDEDPYSCAVREVREEAGIAIQNIRLEAVTFEMHPESENWLCFYFTADHISGEVGKTDEGELVLIDKSEITDQKLWPSIRAIIGHVLDPKDGTVFLKMRYDAAGNVIAEETLINICADK